MYDHGSSLQQQQQQQQQKQFHIVSLNFTFHSFHSFHSFSLEMVSPEQTGRTASEIVEAERQRATARPIDESSSAIF